MSNPAYKTHFLQIGNIKYAHHYEHPDQGHVDCPNDCRPDGMRTTENTAVNACTDNCNGGHSQTIVLIHGYPDTSYTFRHLMPHLLACGYTVIAPDSAGFGNTVADNVESNYSVKQNAVLVAKLCEAYSIKRVVLVGHDFGSVVAQSVLHWFPDLVTAICCISVPFRAPRRAPFRTLIDIVKILPNFKYQLYLASSDSVAQIERYGIARFLIEVYTECRIDFESIIEACQQPVDPMDIPELQVYVDLFKRSGFYYPNKWYSSYELNYLDEIEHEGLNGKLDIPCLFMGGRADLALPPFMWTGQSELFSEGRFRLEEFASSHWLLWEEPKRANLLISDWIRNSL